MSGGSFDYLCLKDADALPSMVHALDAMSGELAKLGYAEDAAWETEELLCIVRQYAVRAQIRIDRLHDIWRAMEWWHSGDSGEEDVGTALAQYREGGANGDG